MNNKTEGQKDTVISPEKYNEILRQAAQMSRKVSNHADDAVYYMDYRLFTGYDKYSDKSRKSLMDAYNQAKTIVSLFEQVIDSKVNYELFD